MNNVLLGFISIVMTFSILVLIEKIFKKEGLYVWISIATIIANILVCKSINVFGLGTCIGNVLFASSFLATDIMNEKYGAHESRKAVIIAVISQIIFVIMTQYALLYTPSSVDVSNDSMKALFSINLRVSIASLFMFFVANMFDIYLYEKIKKKFPKQLWLRNNVSTIISNCLENYIFTFIAFIGIFDIKTVIISASIASLFEMIIAICDTPFLYLSKKLK
jgi:uncharacterized integral membrane protein (TIGR00697 family)